MKFTQDDRGQRDIINIIKTLNEWGIHQPQHQNIQMFWIK